MSMTKGRLAAELGLGISADTVLRELRRSAVTRALCPVLCCERSDAGDAGACPPFVARFLSWPQEHSSGAASIADGRLRYNDRDWQEAPGVLQKTAQVELSILGVEEPPATVESGVFQRRRRYSRITSQRPGEDLA